MYEPPQGAIDWAARAPAMSLQRSLSFLDVALMPGAGLLVAVVAKAAERSVDPIKLGVLEKARPEIEIAGLGKAGANAAALAA